MGYAFHWKLYDKNDRCIVDLGYDTATCRDVGASRFMSAMHTMFYRKLTTLMSDIPRNHPVNRNVYYSRQCYWVLWCAEHLQNAGLRFECRISVSTTYDYVQHRQKFLDAVMNELAMHYPTVLFETDTDFDVKLIGDAAVIPAFYWTIGIIRCANLDAVHHREWKTILQLCEIASNSLSTWWMRLLDHTEVMPWEMLAVQHGPNDTFVTRDYIPKYIDSARDLPKLSLEEIFQ